MSLEGFLSKAPVTIYGAAVGTATVTDFPAILGDVNLPVDMFHSEQGMSDSASDVRFSSDREGETELPRTIIHVNKAASELIVRVRIPVLNGGSDTQIFVWWGNPHAGEPGRGDPSRSEDVYLDNYYGVYEFENISLGWKGVEETTGRYTNGNVSGSVSAIDGHVQGLTALQISSSFGIQFPELMQMAEGQFEIQFWSHFQGAYAAGPFMFGYNNISISWASAGLKFGYNATATERGEGAGGVTTEPNNSWQFHCIKIDYTSHVIDFWRQGEPDPGYNNYASNLANIGNLGGNLGCPPFLLSGLKIVRAGHTPDAWQSVIFRNESDLASFAGTGPTQQSIDSTIYRIEGIADTQSRITIVRLDNNAPLIDNALPENGSFELAHDFPTDISVDVFIRSLAFEQIEYSDVLSDTNKTVMVCQDPDRVYRNS